MRKGFTLLELIVVIIILGILATLGYTQYVKTIEKMRGAEARAIFGSILKLATSYWLEKGTVAGISNADVNIGSGANLIPDSCSSTHYFYYWVWPPTPPDLVGMVAVRCTGGGKSPQGTEVSPLAGIVLEANLRTGNASWRPYSTGQKMVY